MNTRLQVEHPVTELVYGLDLVELQLRVAAGERLPMSQERDRPGRPRDRGAALRRGSGARLSAVDRHGSALPGTAHARVDSALREGLEIGTAFDPMLGKVIAHGVDRQRAIDRLDRALAELELLGVATNAGVRSRRCSRVPISGVGEQDTGLLERILADPS